jgi:hypothetical protein
MTVCALVVFVAVRLETRRVKFVGPTPIPNEIFVKTAARHLVGFGVRGDREGEAAERREAPGFIAKAHAARRTIHPDREGRAPGSATRRESGRVGSRPTSGAGG